MTATSPLDAATTRGGQDDARPGRAGVDHETEPPGPGVDELDGGLVALVRALRAAGLGVGPARTRAFVEAVTHLDVTSAAHVRAAGRATCCGSPADLDVFDRVFDLLLVRGGAAGPGGSDVESTVDVGVPADTPGGEPATTPPAGAGASDVEVVRRRDLAEVTGTEREVAAELIARLRPRPPVRRGRRRAAHHRGRVDRRATTRALLATGGHVARLRRTRARAVPRRVVLVLDVSGSMRLYADAYLRFAYACAQALDDVEVFSAGTRLTRITAHLEGDLEVALQRASARMTDYAGGTRLGETLAELVDRGRRGPLRGAVVVIASDGWERGEPESLGDAMAALSRLARRVVWAHPHRGREGFVPSPAGLQAALPHVDAFVAGHSVDALDAVADLVGHAPRRTHRPPAPREVRRA